MIINLSRTRKTAFINILKGVKGIEDLGMLRNMGQPELQINLNQAKMAQYGVDGGGCQCGN